MTLTNERYYKYQWMVFGASRLVPYKTFIFTSPSAWLTKFAEREEFHKLLEEIFKRQKPAGGILEDIWNGEVWQDF